MSKGWIGVDLDGTLVYYSSGGFDPDHVGEPIKPMLDRVKRWIGEGKTVKIFTARVGPQKGGQAVIDRSRKAIETWCLKHVGHFLEITNQKDYMMVELWDDRCVQVECNTGRRVDGEEE